MVRFLLSSLLVLVLVTQMLDASSMEADFCPADFFQVGDYCFYYDRDHISKRNAELNCASKDASLAYPTARDLKEWQTAVQAGGKENLGSAYTPYWGAWAGAAKLTGGEWQMPDGSEVPEGAWQDDSPRDDAGEPADCSRVGHDGLLYEFVCTDQSNTICQAPAQNASTAPAETTPMVPDEFTMPMNSTSGPSTVLFSSFGFLGKDQLPAAFLLILHLMSVQIPNLALNILFG